MNQKRKFIIFWTIILLVSISLSIFHDIRQEDKIIEQQDNLIYSYRDYSSGTNKEFYFYGFHNDVISALNKFYNENGESEGKEFGVCLKGYVDGNKVYINNYSKYIVGDKTSVVDDKNSYPSIDYCDGKEELGFLHKHPSNNPIPSYEDIKYFLNSFKYHNNTFSIIMYDYNKFEIFTEKNYQYKLNCPNCPEELKKMWNEI